MLSPTCFSLDAEWGKPLESRDKDPGAPTMEGVPPPASQAVQVALVLKRK